MKSFIEDKDEESLLNVGADMRKINFCFTLLKKHVVNNVRKSPGKSVQENDETTVQVAQGIRKFGSSKMDLTVLFC